MSAGGVSGASSTIPETYDYVVPTEVLGDGALMLDALRELDGPMTPAFILAMVAGQLDDMDRQMRLNMLNINNSHSLAERIGNKLQTLLELKGLINDSRATGDDGFEMQKLNEAQASAVAEFLGIDTSLDDDAIKGAFRDAMNEFGISIEHDDEHFSLVQLDAAIDSLEEEQRQINSGNEMVMMRLQDAMQQRSQIIQASSNFLSSIHESAKTIIGNI